MAIHVRFPFVPAARLAYSIERLADGTHYDFKSMTFQHAPAWLTKPLPEGTGPFAGLYSGTLTPTYPDQFKDGDYCINIHELAPTPANGVVACQGCSMANGDDALFLVAWPRPAA